MENPIEIDWKNCSLKFESADSFRDDPTFKQYFHSRKMDKVEPLYIHPTVIFTFKECIRLDTNFQQAMEGLLNKNIIWFYNQSRNT